MGGVMGDQAEAEAPDFRAATCDQCAFGVLRADRAGLECRHSPPVVIPVDPLKSRWGQSHEFSYRELIPAAPACSQFMTPEEWTAYRKAIHLATVHPDGAQIVALNPPVSV